MGKGFISLSDVWNNQVGKRALLSSGICALCFFYMLFVVSETRSLVLTGAAWLTIFSFFAVFSTVLSIGSSGTPTESYTYGFVRVPVVAVFSTTVLAQLSAILQLKEAVESLLAADHHHGPGHGVAAGPAINHHFYSASVATTISLLLAAYNVANQPFQYVLTAAQSSSLQEHAIDISNAICMVFPGMSRFLLPRINAMSLLAFVSTVCCVLTHFFMNDFEWFDSVSTIILAFAVFSTMYPLTYYTGMILLQTTPTHVHNQIDRCMSEATTVDGVLELKNSHFWQLDFNQIAGTVDVRIRRDADEQIVLSLVTEKLCSVIGHLSIQHSCAPIIILFFGGMDSYIIVRGNGRTLKVATEDNGVINEDTLRGVFQLEQDVPVGLFRNDIALRRRRESDDFVFHLGSEWKRAEFVLTWKEARRSRPATSFGQDAMTVSISKSQPIHFDRYKEFLFYAEIYDEDSHHLTFAPITIIDDTYAVGSYHVFEKYIPKDGEETKLLKIHSQFSTETYNVKAHRYCDGTFCQVILFKAFEPSKFHVCSKNLLKFGVPTIGWPYFTVGYPGETFTEYNGRSINMSYLTGQISSVVEASHFLGSSGSRPGFSGGPVFSEYTQQLIGFVVGGDPNATICYETIEKYAQARYLIASFAFRINPWAHGECCYRASPDIAGTVDVRIRRDADEQIVLSLVTEKLCSVIGHLSIQMHRSVVRLAVNANFSRQKLIEKVVRVDHAGELGADRIYAGQMAVLKGSSVSDIIKGMWDEEKEHLDTMERLCAKHQVPPTIFAPIFSVAAYALGVGTALMGKEGAMACTVAVEELIGKHYNSQLKELIDDDPNEHKELLDTLTRLRDEELHHHDTGIAHDGLKAPMYDVLKSVIQTGCKGAIWIAEKV